MKRKTTLGVMLALAAAAPAVVAPQLVSPAHAQADMSGTRAEFPDVPRGHWAYEALDKLAKAGIVEGLPDGTYGGNKSMTRYEFAVAIARLLNRIPKGGDLAGAMRGPQGEKGEKGDKGDTGPQGPPGTGGTAIDLTPYAKKAEVQDLINALRREFADELARLGDRVTANEKAIAALSARIPAPPRVTVSMGVNWNGGSANYIGQRASGGGNTPGRSIVNGNITPGVLPGQTISDTLNGTFPLPVNFSGSDMQKIVDGKFSYTDLELRLTDKVTDRLSVSTALRSLGSTQEDPWAGERINAGGIAGSDNGSAIYAREAFANVDLSDYSVLNIKGLSAVLGRQRTKIAQGLLYDNDLSPTDQVNIKFNLGPLSVSGFNGTNNNQLFSSSRNPYLQTGAVRYIGFSGVGAGLVPGGPFGPNANAGLSGAFAGFPGGGGLAAYPEDNESAVRAGVNLFRIAGQPVGVGLTRLFDGVQDQNGWSADLSVPLFNRTIGFEAVRMDQYANSLSANQPTAWNVTVPVLRHRILDLDFAYGKADNDFEFFVASSANPYARTYGEAIFDRPLALGAPLINGLGRSTGQTAYMAAKKVFDWNGTLRLPVSFLKRFPIDFRYYRAYGSQVAPFSGQKDSLDLGAVYSVGTSFALSPGLDLSFKYGAYNVPGAYRALQYFRAAASVGF